MGPRRKLACSTQAATSHSWLARSWARWGKQHKTLQSYVQCVQGRVCTPTSVQLPASFLPVIALLVPPLSLHRPQACHPPPMPGYTAGRPPCQGE